MTRRELNQLYHLNREIEQDKQRLRELEAAATNCNSRITGMPHAAGISDKTGIAVEIAYLRGVIENKIQRTFYEYNRLINYINGIDDSFVRQVLTLRHINGLTWFQISQHIGGGNTESCVKMAYHRYVVKSCDECDDKS